MLSFGHKQHLEKSLMAHRLFLLLGLLMGSLQAADIAVGAETIPNLPVDTGDPLDRVVATCAACHGADGAAKDNPSIPIIAGQYPRYLQQQLFAFSQGDSGPRPNPLMEPIAQALSDEEKIAISQYYGGLKKQFLTTPNREDLAKGRRIYLGGVFEKKIPACSSCHSPTGFGNEPANYPSLSGQHAEYLIAQLQNYRSRARIHPIMNAEALALSDQEIEAVAYYLQGLRTKNR